LIYVLMHSRKTEETLHEMPTMMTSRVCGAYRGTKRPVGALSSPLGGLVRPPDLHATKKRSLRLMHVLFLSLC
jgi:hypothetical protein